MKYKITHFSVINTKKKKQKMVRKSMTISIQHIHIIEIAHLLAAIEKYN